MQDTLESYHERCADVSNGFDAVQTRAGECTGDFRERVYKGSRIITQCMKILQEYSCG